MVSAKWRPPIPLDGHIYSFGRTGSGKTWKLLAILQFYYARGYKIWDMFGGKRMEGPFWAIPSDEKKLWFEYISEVGEMKSPGPKEYKVNLYYPFFIKTLPDKLPELLPRVTSRVMTLYFKDITAEDISVISGTLTKPQSNIWRTVVKELPDDANGEDILNWFKKHGKSATKNPLFYEFVEPFVEAHILTGKNSPYNINLKEEAEDKEAIFVLAEDYTPMKFRMFFMNYLATRLFELVNKNKIHTKNISFYREMNMFMKVQDASTEGAEQKQILRNRLSDVARYGRSGSFIAGDSQSPHEVAGLIEGQDDLLCLNELPGQKDREVACDRLKADGRMSRQQIAYLGTMPVEQMAVIQRRKNAQLLKRVQPPRTMGWKRETGNFLKVWKEKYNTWRNIKIEKQKILDAYKCSRTIALAHKKVDDGMIGDINLVKIKAVEEKKDINNAQVELERLKKSIMEKEILI